jgi:hemolysin III
MTHPVDRDRERLADRRLHAIGLAAGIVGTIVLLVLVTARRDALALAGVAPYVAGLLAMLACSASYNRSPPSRRKELLRRLDHAAIFVMIAGTYTPFTLVRLGDRGAGLLLFVWSAAAAGAAMKLLYPRSLEGLSVVLYLALGWSGLAAIDALLSALMGSTIVLLAAGGVLYSLGVVFHLLRRLPYHNVVWHAAVLAAAACHYVAVVSEVAAGPAAS